MTESQLSRFAVTSIGILGAANVLAFVYLGMHTRIELGWGFSIGTTDILAGTGLFLAVGWAPFVLTDDPREARILVLGTWLIVGSIMLLAS